MYYLEIKTVLPRFYKYEFSNGKQLEGSPSSVYMTREILSNIFNFAHMMYLIVQVCVCVCIYIYTHTHKTSDD